MVIAFVHHIQTQQGHIAVVEENKYQTTGPSDLFLFFSDRLRHLLTCINPSSQFRVLPSFTYPQVGLHARIALT